MTEGEKLLSLLSKAGIKWEIKVNSYDDIYDIIIHDNIVIRCNMLGYIMEKTGFSYYEKNETELPFINNL